MCEFVVIYTVMQQKHRNLWYLQLPIYALCNARKPSILGSGGLPVVRNPVHWILMFC